MSVRHKKSISLLGYLVVLATFFLFWGRLKLHDSGSVGDRTTEYVRAIKYREGAFGRPPN